MRRGPHPGRRDRAEPLARPTRQAAIDHARAGDTLRIRGGCGGSDTITFGKDLTLKGVTADAAMGALEVGPAVSVGIIDLKVAPPGPLGQQPLGIRNQGRLVLDEAIVNAYRGILNEAAATLLLRESRLAGNLLLRNQGAVTALDSDMVGGDSFFALENGAGATMTLRDSSIGGWNVLSNEGTASLQNVTLDGADRHSSGPISNRAGAVLAIEGSRFTDGFSSGGTGATALWNAGTATITDSAFLRNQGGQAAIVNTGSITLTNVTFRDNHPADCVGCQ